MRVDALADMRVTVTTLLPALVLMILNVPCPPVLLIVRTRFPTDPSIPRLFWNPLKWEVKVKVRWFRSRSPLIIWKLLPPVAPLTVTLVALGAAASCSDCPADFSMARYANVSVPPPVTVITWVPPVPLNLTRRLLFVNPPALFQLPLIYKSPPEAVDNANVDELLIVRSPRISRG